MAGLSVRQILDHNLRAGFITRTQYDRAVAKLPGSAPSGQPSVPPSVPVAVPAHLLPTITPSPEQVAAAREQARAKMSPSELVAEYLSGHPDSSASDFPPILTPQR